MGLLKSGWGNLTNAWNGWSGGVGGWLNNLTGSTSAMKAQQNYNLQSGAINQAYALQSGAVNNKYQQEFAKNAHQWEIQDLAKAGLNPVLSAGGSGASASGGGVSAGTVSGSGLAHSGINPMQTAVDMWGGVENAMLTNATTKNTAQKTEEASANVENINQDTILKYWQTLTEMEKGKLTATQREKIETEKQRLVKLMPYEMAQMQENIKNTNTDTKVKRKQAREVHASVKLGPFGEWGLGGNH